MTREEAREAIKEAYGNSEYTEEIIKALEHEPRKGHWIKGYTYPDGKYWECDKCNVLIKVRYPMHYCTNCGSDNRKEDE